jgi:hypothetical protein
VYLKWYLLSKNSVQFDTESFKKQNQTSYIITFQVKLDWGTRVKWENTFIALSRVLEYASTNSCLKNDKYCNEVTNQKKSFTCIIETGTLPLTITAAALYWTPS